MPDWLTLNPQNGQVRRYVEVAEWDVIEDLLGVRPLENQNDLRSRWGNPEPSPSTGWMKLLQDSSPGSWVELIKLARFPVFGLGSNICAMDLEFGSASAGGDHRGVMSVSLKFLGHTSHSEFLITSSHPLFQRRLRSADYVQHPAHGHPSMHQSVPTSSVDLERDILRITLGHIVFTGELASPQYPHDLECLLGQSGSVKPIMFSLWSQEAALRGSVSGIEYETVLLILQSLEPVNEREDVLASYVRSWHRAH